MTSKYLLLCLLGTLVCFVGNSVSHEAIIDAAKVTDHQFAYQVAILLHGNFYKCGGGIIGDFYILTAAHCVIKDDGLIFDKLITVHAGSNNWFNPAVVREVKKMFISLDFKLTHDSFGDIAVLKLKHALGLSSNHQHLKHLELPKHKDESYDGHSAKIAGFGWNWMKVNEHLKKIEGGASDTYLRFAEASVVSNSHCETAHHPAKIIHKHLCAKVKHHGDSKPRGVCIGDSGSPLVVDGHTVIGILSKTSSRCFDEEKPGVYTRVGKYVDLIEHALHDKVADNTFVYEFPN